MRTLRKGESGMRLSARWLLFVERDDDKRAMAHTPASDFEIPRTRPRQATLNFERSLMCCSRRSAH